MGTELIDRYVYAVTERLPADSREDVARELRANIEDMLPEDASEKDIRVVLEKLGNPVKLSNEYRQEKRYLIGPALYDSYISVLKLVVGITVFVFILLALLGSITKSIDSYNLPKTISDIFTDFLSAGFDGAVQAFLWVTLVFTIMERSGVNNGDLPFVKHNWTINDLQPVPTSDQGKISRSETIVSYIFTVLFTAILVFQPQLVGFYEKTDSGLIFITPLLNINQLKLYIPPIVLLAIFQLGISTYKFVTRRWTLPLAVVNLISNLASSILVSIMFNDKIIFEMNFISRFAVAVNISSKRMTAIWENSITIFIALFIFLCAVDSINGFVKCRRQGIKFIK